MPLRGDSGRARRRARRRRPRRRARRAKRGTPSPITISERSVTRRGEVGEVDAHAVRRRPRRRRRVKTISLARPRTRRSTVSPDSRSFGPCRSNSRPSGRPARCGRRAHLGGAPAQVVVRRRGSSSGARSRGRPRSAGRAPRRVGRRTERRHDLGPSLEHGASVPGIGPARSRSAAHRRDAGARGTSAACARPAASSGRPSSVQRVDLVLRGEDGVRAARQAVREVERVVRRADDQRALADGHVSDGGRNSTASSAIVRSLPTTAGRGRRRCRPCRARPDG